MSTVQFVQSHVGDQSTPDAIANVKCEWPNITLTADKIYGKSYMCRKKVKGTAAHNSANSGCPSKLPLHVSLEFRL